MKTSLLVAATALVLALPAGAVAPVKPPMPPPADAAPMPPPSDAPAAPVPPEPAMPDTPAEPMAPPVPPTDAAMPAEPVAAPSVMPEAAPPPPPPPPSELAKDYPACSAAVTDSCVNRSDAGANKKKAKRKPS